MQVVTALHLGVVLGVAVEGGGEQASDLVAEPLDI
jgi:hypothetical protein